MATITYGAATPANPDKPAAKRKGAFRRFFEALHESRMRQAQREIARYRHLMPGELEAAARKLNRRNEDGLPFVR